jgi:hypothetical protein
LHLRWRRGCLSLALGTRENTEVQPDADADVYQHTQNSDSSASTWPLLLWDQVQQGHVSISDWADVILSSRTVSSRLQLLF